MQLRVKVQFWGEGGTDMFSELRVYIKQLLFLKKSEIWDTTYRSINFYLFSGGNGFHGFLILLEVIVHPKMITLSSFTLVSYQTCMSFFLLLNTE